VSVYLTVAHYAQIPLACVNGGAVDCGAVTASSFGLVPGTAIPISVPGLVWFTLSGALFAVALFAEEAAWPPIAHLALAGAGLVVALYLVYAEIVVINRICEWCTLLHLLILGIFVIALRRVQTAT
jgi:uncharacterized membrane protein